jgi:formate dehydrogenase assembly factor FdhD
MTKKRWKEIKDKAERSLDHVRTHAKHEIVELINEIERLQQQLNETIASHEASWYDCHDGSESACCKVHE